MPLATQQFLEINQIREGVIVLKNQALRGVLMVSSLNFASAIDRVTSLAMMERRIWFLVEKPWVQI